MELPEMERRLTSYQQLMENEYDRFTKRLSDFINREISQFGQRLTLLEGTSQNIQDIGTQAREVSQAMSERVDKVENQLESIRLNMKTEAYLAVSYKVNELKTEVTSAVDQKMMALETRLMGHINEIRQTMAIRLQEINNLVTTVWDGQHKIWGAIEEISKDLQELVQRDAGTDEEINKDPAPAIVNLDTTESAPVGRDSRSTLPLWQEGIPKGEESSVKDSVTSGLPIG